MLNKELWVKLLKYMLKILDFIFEEIIETGGAEETPTTGKTEIEKFLFPMEYLRVTQGENQGTHMGGYAMDFGGKDTGCDELFAPCTMKIVRIRNNANGEVYCESIKPVKFADGAIDIARLLLLHDSEAEKTLHVGDIIPQGDYFYSEGGMGGGNPKKFANHVHVEAGKGTWEENGGAIHYRTGYKDDKGENTFAIKNPVKLDKMFILPRDTIILDGGGYDWIYC